jgi:hypothetical protein
MRPKEERMLDIETARATQMTKTWWSERTPFEKVGVVALSVAAGAVTAAIVFPHAAAAAGGGALTATGGLLLKKALGK